MHTHSQHLERWLGVDAVKNVSNAMLDWYGPPIAMQGVPGKVYACKGGDFVGRIEAGSEVSARERVEGLLKRSARARRILRGLLRRQGGMAGFATLADLIAEAKGAGKYRFYKYDKTITGGASSNVTSDMFTYGSVPLAGAVGGAAPGGTVHASGETGSFLLDDVSPDTRHFVGGEVTCTVTGHSLLFYDRLFSVAKTMNSTTTEAVTGVPTRYQSTTATDANYAGGNFLYPAVGNSADLPATAHNWTVCTYTDQGGNASTLPSVAGRASAQRASLDLPLWYWFAPLEPGDTGVKALTQMQCDAAVASGTIDFVIGHPLAWFACPLAGTICAVDGINTAFNLVRVFDGACISMIEVNKTSSSSTIYRGSFSLVHG